MQKTKQTRKNNIERHWHLYDVSGKILGRVCSEIATTLRGKSKPYFVPHLDCGDYVVVINARDIKVTGNKEEKKIYTRYSGYPGGLRKDTLKDVMKDNPEKVIRNAVVGMLPDNKLKDKLLRRLYVFAGGEHPFKDKLVKEN